MRCAIFSAIPVELNQEMITENQAYRYYIIDI
jgi:hypothetical protein